MINQEILKYLQTSGDISIESISGLDTSDIQKEFRKFANH